MTRKYLKRIEFLSVREIKGAEIIKEILDKDAFVALDPTLVFSSLEWDQYFKPECVCNEPYIFTYFLGKNTEHREAVEKLQKAKGLKIITCPHMDHFVERDIEFGDEKMFDIDPIIFLNLIRGATYICTDSFHGSVFSILNHKQFITFDRHSDTSNRSKNSRIVSLFELLNLENRRYTQRMTDISQSIDSIIDYSNIESKLEKLRNETLSFLDSSLDTTN